MNTESKNYHRLLYSEDELRQAVDSIKNKQMSLNAASKAFKIPKGTLHNKIKGKVPFARKMGPEPVLKLDEENRIEKWILDKAKLGFPMHPEDVKDAVQSILKSLQRKNPFADDRPGRKWLKLFLQRHPKISKRQTEIISKARASVTEDIIRTWFRDLELFLMEENCLDVIEDNSRVLNCDETGMQTCPKTGLLLGPKGYTNFYNVASGKEKESITVLCTFSARGDVLPPMIVFPYKRMPNHIINSVPDDWAWGRSDSGWMVSATFYEYVSNVLYPWLVKSGTKFPVIFFLDGHKSHLSIELCNFCIEKKIIIYCLPPNATHIVQPCDVAIFGPLKIYWKQAVRKYKQKTGKDITKSNFCTIFKEAFDVAVKADTIKNGFRVCGLFPFSADAVDYSKCLSKRRQELEVSQISEVVKEDYLTAKKVIEKIIGQERSSEFQQRSKSEGAVRKVDSIFDVWLTCDREGLDENNTSYLNLNNNENAVYQDILTDNNDSFDILALPVDIIGHDYLLDPDAVQVHARKEHENDSEIINGNNVGENLNSVRYQLTVNDHIERTEINANEEQMELEDQLENKDQFCESYSKKSENDPVINTNDDNGEIENFPQTVEEKEKGNSVAPLSEKTLDLNRINNDNYSSVKNFWSEHLSWPRNDEKRVSKRKSENVPYAITSKRWREIQEDKAKLKETKERQLKEKREEKAKLKKDKMDRQHRSSSSKQKTRKNKIIQSKSASEESKMEKTIIEVNRSNNEEGKYVLGDYVIILHESEELFPGMILDAEGEDFEVSILKKKNDDSWVWPKQKQKKWYHKDCILEKIKTPIINPETKGLLWS